MKNLNICVDIDGTITDPYYWLDAANKYFHKNITCSQVTEYAIHEVMGISLNEFENFYEKYKFKIHSEEKLRKDAKPVIEKLIQCHSIYFITARDKDLTMLTHNYLRKNQIPYDDLFVLGSPYKVNKANELNCSVFIEDCYENALQLSNAGFKVLLMDTNYNRKPADEGIIRVHNWQEIYLTINNLLLQRIAM